MISYIPDSGGIFKEQKYPITGYYKYNIFYVRGQWIKAWAMGRYWDLFDSDNWTILEHISYLNN